MKIQVLWSFLRRGWRGKVLWSVSLLPVFRYSLIIKRNLMGQKYKLKWGRKSSFLRKERNPTILVTYASSNAMLLPADWLCFYATLTWISRQRWSDTSFEPCVDCPLTMSRMIGRRPNPHQSPWYKEDPFSLCLCEFKNLLRICRETNSVSLKCSWSANPGPQNGLTSGKHLRKTCKTNKQTNKKALLWLALIHFAYKVVKWLNCFYQNKLIRHLTWCYRNVVFSHSQFTQPRLFTGMHRHCSLILKESVQTPFKGYLLPSNLEQYHKEQHELTSKYEECYSACMWKCLTHYL